MTAYNVSPASSPQTPEQVFEDPEVYTRVAASLHGLTHAALQESSEHEVYGSKAVRSVIESVLKGDQGPEAQSVLWEVGAASQRLTRSNEVLQKTDEYSHDLTMNVANTLDNKGNIILRKDRLDARLRGKKGIIDTLSATLNTNASNLRDYLLDPAVSTWKKSDDWARTVDFIAGDTVKDVSHYHTLATEEVDGAIHAVFTAVGYIRHMSYDMDLLADNQQKIRDDLSNNMPVDEKLLGQTFSTFTVAMFLTESIAAGGPEVLSERMQSLIRSAPTGSAFKQVAESMALATEPATDAYRSVNTVFDDTMRATTGRAYNHVNEQFASLKADILSTNVTLGGYSDALYEVPAGALSTLKTSAHAMNNALKIAVAPLTS